MHMLEALNLRSKYTNAAEDYVVRQPGELVLGVQGDQGQAQ